jgi:teichuronic acid biosynthesis glycosyltransferase TuaH
MSSGRNLAVHVLPNGYDERLFDPERKFPELPILAGIRRPRILVTGHVSERIDWDGVANAIKERPNWTWVFVGPADPEIPKKIVQLSIQTDNRSNREDSPRIVWHDAVPLKEVPALIDHCDACAVPYRLNAFTRASSPLKAIEYLAMGAPVLSTRVPSLERYRNAIEWVDEGDGDSYGRALDKLLQQAKKQGIRASRRLAVAEDSWRVRTDQFKRIVLDRMNSSWADLMAVGPALRGA